MLTYQATAVPVVINNKILFAGGIATGGVGVTKVISVYNDSTGLWSEDSLSLGRFGHAAAAIGNIAVFAGGYINTTNYTTTNRVDIFNVSTGLRTTAALSQARGNKK